MVRKLAITFGLLVSTQLIAETPATVAAGALVNSWTQAGLEITDKPFDFGIQGHGFFALQLESGANVYTRNGQMALSLDGFLIHKSSKAKVLGFCNGSLKPVKLSHYSYDHKGTVVKSFRTGTDGAIFAIYDSGYEQKTCTLALAIFSDPSNLVRENHLLTPNNDTGNPFIGTPLSDVRGTIYSGTLETLDEKIYQINLGATK
jgi:flagellar basal body rod protein FlgG